MEGYRVLLVEDDPEIARIVRRYLADDGFEVTWCRSTGEVMALPDVLFDAALLDIVLGDGSGLDVCARIRAAGDCPIIFVSCLDDSDTIIKALEMGGDDYIAKPFDERVLVARLKANLRRAGSLHRDASLRNRYEFAGFSLDVESRTVQTASGRASKLTPLEFQLLTFLIRNPGVYYPTTELYGNIWGKNSYGDTRTVIVLVHSLREKVEEDPSSPRYLVNSRGRGYAFMPDQAE